MIRKFSDHSANERTFLAWVRTAIAVMAFGFLVEKFDLFLELAAPALSGRTLSLPGQKW
jgi:putative membrane protein